MPVDVYVCNDCHKTFERILTLPPTWRPETRWDKFEPYTARAVTARLAEIFDNVPSSRCQG